MSGQNNPVFDRDVMYMLFKRVGEICAEQNVTLEIAVYGGSSLMLQPSLFDVRRVTEDIDFVPLSQNQDEEINDIFMKATQELGYVDRVFRDDVKQLISDQPEYDFLAEYPEGVGSFRVFHCKPEYLLAMKAMAMRSGLLSSDPIDFFNLAADLGVTTLDEVKARVDKYFPGHELPRSHELTIEDLFEYGRNLPSLADKDDRHIRYIAR